MIRRALDWLANAKSVNDEVNADALRPTCLPHPPEAWVRHKVSWN